jgi:hypothetical protein
MKCLILFSALILTLAASAWPGAFDEASRVYVTEQKAKDTVVVQFDWKAADAILDAVIAKSARELQPMIDSVMKAELRDIELIKERLSIIKGNLDLLEMKGAK